MRTLPGLLAFLALGACSAADSSREGAVATRTTITERVPVRGLADSVAAPAPRGIALQLVADTGSGGTPGTHAGPPVTNADSAKLCALALRDPATGARFLITRSVVRTELDSTTTANVVRHRLQGWADYMPVDPASVGLATDVRLRVDCATNTVAGIAPATAV